MRKAFAVLCLTAALAGCNWTQQLDRDFGVCAVAAKTGGSCTVTIPPRPEN